MTGNRPNVTARLLPLGKVWIRLCDQGHTTAKVG